MTFELKTDYIELFKLLKIMDLANSGGEAKQFIADGHVVVNDTVETRKAYKVRRGDVISFNEEVIHVN